MREQLVAQLATLIKGSALIGATWPSHNPVTSRPKGRKSSSQRHNPCDEHITPLTRMNSPCDGVTHHHRSRHNVTFPPHQHPSTRHNAGDQECRP